MPDRACSFGVDQVANRRRGRYSGSLFCGRRLRRRGEFHRAHPIRLALGLTASDLDRFFADVPRRRPSRRPARRCMDRTDRLRAFVPLAAFETRASLRGGEVTGATVTFDNVLRFYGEFLCVNRVTLSIPPGITSLVGPNGSGKTTLINLIFCHDPPTT